MPLAFVIDEHIRGPLLQAIQTHNAGGGPWIDAVQVGDVATLPLGTKDRDILLWAEREGRIVVSNDRDTLPGFLTQHLQAGHHSPGVFLVDIFASTAALVGFLDNPNTCSQGTF